MAEPPLTRVTLLTRIRDGRDAEAWHEFVQLYGPVVYRFARNRGLQDADAADLMQDVLRSVARNAHRMEYDPKRGTFRGWLYTVTRNKIYNFLAAQRNRPARHRRHRRPRAARRHPRPRGERRPRRRVGEGVSARGLSARAMERVKHEFQPTTWQAFWETAVEGKAASDVGDESEDDTRGGVRRQEPRAGALAGRSAEDDGR